MQELSVGNRCVHASLAYVKLLQPRDRLLMLTILVKYRSNVDHFSQLYLTDLEPLTLGKLIQTDSESGSGMNYVPLEHKSRTLIQTDSRPRSGMNYAPLEHKSNCRHDFCSKRSP